MTHLFKYQKKFPQIYIKEFPFHLNEKAKQKVRNFGQFLGILLLTAFIAYILLNNFAPFGIVMTYSLQTTPKDISQPGPKGRVKIETHNGQIIIHQLHDLVYFSTKMPFLFDKAKVRITFKNPNPDQTISLGFQDQGTWHYANKPLDVPFLNTLNWNRIGTNPILYQKEKHFNSVNDFLHNLPTNALIGTYAYDNDLINVSSTLQNYKPSPEDTIINTPLRGRHILYVYLHNEQFHMTIEKQDLNWYEDPDPMTIKVYKDRALVYQVNADDDGIEDNSRKILPPEAITIKNPGPNLPENGVYKIVIDATADTIINKITTNLHKIVFANSLFLVTNSDAYGTIVASTTATTIYTNALLLSASTYHREGLQDVTVGDQIMHITGVKDIYSITPPEDVTKIVIPKNDVALTGLQGYFAFSPEQFFQPTPYHTTSINTKDDTSLTDYILTEYLPSQKSGDWQVKDLTFDIHSGFIKNGQLSWILMSPKLKDGNKEILIKNIEVTLYKEPWI